MNINEFDTFDDAKSLALNLVEYFKSPVAIIRSEAKFVVNPEAIPLANFEMFGDLVYTFGFQEKVLSFIKHVDTLTLRSPTLVWQDFSSGLTWDVSRLFCGNARTELPRDRAELMNTIAYGGKKTWRLPSLEELRTLTVTKLDQARLQNYVNNKGEAKFWSDEISLYSGPEKAFLDIISKRRGDQYFKEQDKDRSSYGDGYTQNAQTLMVAV